MPAVVDLDALDGVRDGLIDAIEAGPGRRSSAAAVERVSTNALFMLLSAAETARRNNFPFAIAAASAPMRAAIERLGLARSFAGIDERIALMRVLTVDDSRTILAMLHHTLSNAGFEVLQAEDGQKGLDVLASEKRRRRDHRHQHAGDGRHRVHQARARQRASTTACRS